MKRLMVLLCGCLPLLLSCQPSVTELELADLSGEYKIRIQLDGFRFEFIDVNGETIVSKHRSSGLVFDGFEITQARLLAKSNDRYQFALCNNKDQKAEVEVIAQQHGFQFKVTPKQAGENFSVRLALKNKTEFYGLGDYGLGDYGLGGYGLGENGLGEKGLSGNLWGLHRQALNNDGGHNRFVSSFAIAPTLGFAQVAIVQQSERYQDGAQKAAQYVSLNSDEVSLGFEGVTGVSHLYYFLGTPEQIYQAFSRAKKSAGYADVQPQYRAFGVGWEAWPLLSWRTNAKVVQRSVSEFIEQGIEIDWAILGSGFWQHGGTTTSFGRWNVTADKYPNPDAFLQWFGDRGIPLMLGLRTQFVDGLGLNAGSGRDGNFGIYLDGRPVPEEYPEALAENYFAHQGLGLFGSGSNVFPQWDKNFALLDSNNADAVDWYVDKTALWKSAGWKEDTMLTAPSGTYHDGHWNPIMTALHQRGDLVIARNAYVSSPGSLQRINDTHGEEDRIPQLVLAYGASGAANVYTDIIGNGEQDNEQYLVRHSQLQALTAGMSFGIRPWQLSPDAAAAIAIATAWHKRYQAYIHSASLKAYSSGFPYTATPLPLRYVDDTKVAGLAEKRQWQWLIDDNLLAHPLFDRQQTEPIRDVYLPEGRWLDANTGELFEGPLELVNYPHPINSMPVFIGGSGILVAESKGEDKGEVLQAEVWPLQQAPGSYYQYLHCRALVCDEPLKTNIELAVENWQFESLLLINLSSERELTVQRQKNGRYLFNIQPGQKYRLQNLH